MSSLYLDLLEALRVSCNLPPFPDPLPSTELDLELEGGPTVTLDFNEEREAVEIFSEIGKYSLEVELEILKKISEDNFLWEKTFGATLSARPEVQTLYLAYQAPVSSLIGSEFVHRVEKFIEVVQEWKKILLGEDFSVLDENQEP
jgi:hypothetical protein